MNAPDVPPCPKELLRKLRALPRSYEKCEGLQVQGAVWEVCAPTGEFLLVLIARKFEAGEAAPFAFLRVVPLSDFVRLTDTGDTIVVIEPSGDIVAAHCWLEGPIMPETLVRQIGVASAESMEAVEKVRNRHTPAVLGTLVIMFRESLFEQFDPLYSACWNRLYAVVEDETSETELGEMIVNENEEITYQSTTESVDCNIDALRFSGRKRRYTGDLERALAASDNPTSRGNIDEKLRIQYLTDHLLEILGHGGSSVWLGIDSSGAIIGHTYDSNRAAAFPNGTGPHAIPTFVHPRNLIKPEVHRLITWLTSKLGVPRAAAEQVCLNLGFRW